MASLFLCIATLLVGIFTIGIAAGTFYGLLSESPAPQSAFKLSQLGKPQFLQTMLYAREWSHFLLGYSFCISSKTDEFTSLKALEGTLFGCGLASIFVNSLSIMFLHLEKLMSREETVSPGSLPTRNFNRYWKRKKKKSNYFHHFNLCASLPTLWKYKDGHETFNVA